VKEFFNEEQKKRDDWDRSQAKLQQRIDHWIGGQPGTGFGAG
jgi:hypothetical protein